MVSKLVKRANGAKEKHQRTEKHKSNNEKLSTASYGIEEIALVLDTSIFVNPEIRSAFGKSPADAFETFIKLVKPIRWIRLYMAPSAWEELLSFVNDVSPLAEILVIKKAPRVQEECIPLSIVYDFVKEMRDRINKGLRIVEKSLRSENTSENVRKMRNEYREALRHGIIDSIADMDTLMLAKELDGILITADDGLKKWAKKMGVPYMNAKKIKQIIDLLRAEAEPKQ